MAWITVDQKLIGGKLRDFAKKSNISQNEAIGILVRLWLWAIDNTDSQGQIIAADHEDIEDAIRAGFKPDEMDKIPDVVTNLIDCGWLDSENEKIYVHDWMDWRTYYIEYQNALDKKEKDAERVRRYRANKAAEKEKTEETPAEPEKPQEKAQEKPKKASGYTPEFEEFWSAYPRKVEKGNAFKKYKTRLKDGYTDEQLITAAKSYRAECERNHTETVYIKHPKTFLSDTKPFTDYLEQSTTEQPKRLESGANPFRRAY